MTVLLPTQSEHRGKNFSMGLCSSQVVDSFAGSTIHEGNRKVHIPIPEHLEDWQRMDEPNLHKTIHFFNKSYIRSRKEFLKKYGGAVHEEKIKKHRTKHEFSVKKLMKKNGLKQYAHLFEGMSPGDAARFAKNGLTFDKRKELHMKGEHYHKICEILHVETAAPPAVHKNKGHTGVMELDELVKIVKRSEKLTHEKIPPEDCKRIATFCWTFRDVLRDESFKMEREVKFDQSIFMSPKYCGDFTDRELQHMFRFFDKADVFKNGYIVHDDLSDYFAKDGDEYSHTVFIDLICHDYGSVDKPGFLDVKEFCSLVETICLMHEDELLHFSFHELQYKQEEDKFDEIPFIDLRTLLDRISSFKRAKKLHDKGEKAGENWELFAEMEKFHKGHATPTKDQARFGTLLDHEKLRFKDWAKLTHDAPSAYYGMIWAQEEFRKRSGLGVKFWKNRRKKLGKDFDVNHEHEVRLQAKLEASKLSHELDYAHHSRKGYRKGDRLHRKSTKVHGKHGSHAGRYKHVGT